MTATTSIDLTMTAFHRLDLIEREEPADGATEYRLIPLAKHSSPFTDDSDCDATASTALLDDDYSESSSLATTSRRVHFQLDAITEYDNTSVFQEDLHELWYDAFEYRDFKRSTHASAKHMASVELRNRAPHSYQRTLTRVYQLCLEQRDYGHDDDDDDETGTDTLLSAAEQRHMQHWAQATPCRLGMEKWALTELQKERSQRKHLLKHTVLDLQRKAQSRSSAAVVPPHEQHLPLDERVRLASERLSLTSRLFARHMALSLAAAEANQVTIA